MRLLFPIAVVGIGLIAGCGGGLSSGSQTPYGGSSYSGTPYSSEPSSNGESSGDCPQDGPGIPTTGGSACHAPKTDEYMPPTNCVEDGTCGVTPTESNHGSAPPDEPSSGESD